MCQRAALQDRVSFISATSRKIAHSILLILVAMLSGPASHADERSETTMPLVAPIISGTPEIPAVAVPNPTQVQSLADCPEQFKKFGELTISRFGGEQEIAETYSAGQTPPSLWAYSAVFCLRNEVNATIAAINARFSGEHDQLNGLHGYATEQSHRIYRSKSDIRTINNELEVIDERLDALEKAPKPPGTGDALSGTSVAIESNLQQFVDIAADTEPPVVQIFNDLKDVKEPVRQQIDPNADVAPLFPDLNRLGFLVATVPDPIVPRQLRSYDESIAALIQGMLSQGYVLDRYAFPWQAKLHQRDAATAASTKIDQQEQAADDGKFGLMVFRQDLWRREDKEKATSVRAVYVIPETASYGVATDALGCAVDRISEQLSLEPPPVKGLEAKLCRAKPSNDAGKATIERRPASAESRKKSSFVSHPYCKPTTDGGPYLTILGPGVSGSLDSLLQFAARTKLTSSALPVDGRTTIAINGFCLVSSATTATSNQQVGAASRGLLQLIPLAVQDSSKLTALRTIVNDLDIRPEHVAFLTEATTFGNEVCGNLRAVVDDENKKFCGKTSVVSFPANIADVRYGLHQKKAAAKAKAPIDLSLGNDYLPLEDGAENGSEFPESQQSRLTISSIDRRLDTAFKGLERQGARVVVVVATDIRDRLFLFERLRARLPEALLVDFEADHLLAHPDFVNASRGALVLASSPFLESEEKIPESQQTRHSVWATDRQKLLYDAVSLLGKEPTLTLPKPQRDPTLHVIGLESLHPLTGSGSDDDGRAYWWLSLMLLAILLVVSFIFTKMVASVALFALAPVTALACGLANSDSRLPVLIAATLGSTAVWHVLGTVRDIRKPLLTGTDQAMVIAGIVAIFMLLPFSAWCTSATPLIDSRQMRVLNFDPYSGLAYGLVAMLGASLVPFAIAVRSSRRTLKEQSHGLFNSLAADPPPIGREAHVPLENSDCSFSKVLWILAGTIAVVMVLATLNAYVAGGWRVAGDRVRNLGSGHCQHDDRRRKPWRARLPDARGDRWSPGACDGRAPELGFPNPSEHR